MVYILDGNALQLDSTLLLSDTFPYIMSSIAWEGIASRSLRSYLGQQGFSLWAKGPSSSPEIKTKIYLRTLRNLGLKSKRIKFLGVSLVLPKVNMIWMEVHYDRVGLHFSFIKVHPTLGKQNATAWTFHVSQKPIYERHGTQHDALWRCKKLREGAMWEVFGY